MAKSKNPVAIAGIVAGLLGLVVYLVYANITGPAAEIRSPIERIRVEEITLTELKDPEPIREEPPPEPIIKVGQDWTVDILVDPQELAGAPAERDDRLRDWVMLAVLSRSDLEAEGRQKAIAAFSAGDGGFARSTVPPTMARAIRSVEVAKGKLLLLVPKSTDAERKIVLAAAADEMTWKSHERPREIDLYEYDLTPERMLAHVKRDQSLAEKDLFSDEYGYRQVEVARGEELKAFLATVDDVVMLGPLGKLEDCRLGIGGRRLPGRPPAGMTREQAATAWETYLKSGKTWAAYLKNAEDKRQSCDAWCREQRDEFAAKWRAIKNRIDLADADDDDIESSQRDARLEAAALATQIRQKVDALREDVDKDSAAAEAELHKNWQSIPETLASAWKKLRLEP
jgi:hypothetical protein